jgi:protein phosphatase
VRKRPARGRLTVVDATTVQPDEPKSLFALAKGFNLFAEAIVFDLSERICQYRSVRRPDRHSGPYIIRNQSQQLRRSLRGLEREGTRTRRTRITKLLIEHRFPLHLSAESPTLLKRDTG